MVKRKYRKKGYTCKQCGANFPKPQSLGGHVTSIHSPVDLDFILLMKNIKKKSDKIDEKNSTD